jgi:hypothetical protein
MKLIKVHQDIQILIAQIYEYMLLKLNIKDLCVIDKKDYMENTELGEQIYEIIENMVIKNLKQDPINRWKLYNNYDIKDQINQCIKEYKKRRLH